MELNKVAFENSLVLSGYLKHQVCCDKIYCCKYPKSAKAVMFGLCHSHTLGNAVSLLFSHSLLVDCLRQYHLPHEENDRKRAFCGTHSLEINTVPKNVSENFPHMCLIEVCQPIGFYEI